MTVRERPSPHDHRRAARRTSRDRVHPSLTSAAEQIECTARYSSPQTNRPPVDSTEARCANERVRTTSHAPLACRPTTGQRRDPARGPAQRRGVYGRRSDLRGPRSPPQGGTPSLKKLDLGHAPILPPLTTEPVSGPGDRTFTLYIRVLPSRGRHSIRTTRLTAEHVVPDAAPPIGLKAVESRTKLKSLKRLDFERRSKSETSTITAPVCDPIPEDA